MKTITFVEIENHQIITNIDNASPDPEETNTIVEAIIAKNPDILSQKKREELLTENVVFARIDQSQKNVDDAVGEKLKCILGNLGTHEKLLLSGDIIADCRDMEYYVKQEDVWNKQKIERMGETLPLNAVLPDDLSQTQQQEITDQTDAARIFNLTPNQKAEEKEVALTSAKREVRCLKEEAEIAGEPFDAKKEYQLRKAKIEEKYG